MRKPPTVNINAATVLRDIERMDEEDGMESNGLPSQPQEATKGEFQRLEGYNLWITGLVVVHFILYAKKF